MPVVNAFLAAARDGDFESLLAVLDSDVVVRSDGGAARPGLASLVCGRAVRCPTGDELPPVRRDIDEVLVNGIPGGVAWDPDRSPFAVLALAVKGGKVVRIDVLADPERLGQLDLTVVAG